MANFENSFTGKGTGLVMPSGERLDKAQQNMSEMILGAEKLKQETFQRNQQEFLKNANIDPAFVLATSAQETQAKMLDGFNAKWGKVMKERGGNMTTDDKMQMAKEKNFILMSQQKMQSEMQMAMAAKDAMNKDVQGTLDHEDIQKRWDDYSSTGNWDASPLMPSALPIEDVFGTRKISTGNAYEEPDKSNPDRIVQYSATKADAALQIANEAHSKPRVMRDVLNEWNRLPQEVKDKKLADKSGQNPILQSYIDNHWKNLVDAKFVNKPRTPSTSRTTFDWNVNVGSGHNQNSKFQDQGVQKIASVEGDFDLPNYKNLGQVSQTSETQNIPEVIVKDKNGNETVKKLNETALFHVVGFSDKTDKLVIQLDGNSSGDMTYMKGDILVVPASGFNDLLQKKPFGIFRGQTPTAPPSTPAKKTYNSKTGKFE